MKVLKIIMTVLMLSLVLSGCDKPEPLALKSPDALIAPPLSNQERAQQKRIIMEKLSTGETLTVPEDMENPTAFLMDDFNHDGKEEILAFYHNSNAYEQGFIILTESDTEPGVWDEAQRVTEVGSEVKRFEAIDMDGDGQKEILFGVKGYTKENLLYCYTYSNGQWQKLGRIEYDALRLVERKDGNFLKMCIRDRFILLLPTTDSHSPRPSRYTWGWTGPPRFSAGCGGC